MICPECRHKWTVHEIGPCEEQEVCDGSNHIRCVKCNNRWCYFDPYDFFIDMKVPQAAWLTKE